MSSLIGRANEAWSLSRAIDALRDSARQAGRPGLVWIVGLLYPSVGIGLTWVSSTVVERSESAGATSVPLPAWVPIWMCAVACISLVCFPLFRLVAGLARVSPAEVWTEACEGRSTPRIGSLWKNGAGMTLSVTALWLLLVVTVGLSLFAVAIPAEHLVTPFMHGAHNPGPASIAGMLLLGPLVVLFLSYALSMTVLTQLALHSLAHNHRGIGSALLHGWRIMRHDVSATVRAVIVDVLLTVAIMMVTTMIGSLTPGNWLDWVDWIIGITLTGFAESGASGVLGAGVSSAGGIVAGRWSAGVAAGELIVANYWLGLATHRHFWRRVVLHACARNATLAFTKPFQFLPVGRPPSTMGGTPPMVEGGRNAMRSTRVCSVDAQFALASSPHSL